jgi:CMP-N,N'-diacetyllegionaminic acid synthase
VWKDWTVLAVVPARGGSKGIPRKNLRQVCGVSLVGHAARTIKAADWIDASLISTDDAQISAEAQRHGLAAPFVRPVDLAIDTATSADMWVHAWLEAERFFGKRFDVSVLLEPTSPLRRPMDVQAAVDLLWTSKSDSVMTVSQTPAHFTPEKTLKVDEQGRVRSYLDHAVTRRQDIAPYFHRNGVCYAVTRECLVDNHQIMSSDCCALIIDRPLVNIDDELELAIAELIMSSRETYAQ